MITASTTARNGMRRAATEQRRREILDAALKCFLTHGVRDTTLEEIRELSSASTGSIYHQFGSKDEIAFALFVEGMRDYHDRVLAAAAGKRTARTLIRAIIAAHLRITAEEPELSLYLTQMGTADEVGEIAAEYREAGDSFARDLYAALKPFIDAGEIVALPQELYFSLIIGPAAHRCRSWLRGRSAADPRTAAEPLAEAAWRSLRGLGTTDRGSD
ncbi:MAG: TetR family transcriptional regulator [Planctomycetia bacterium]|nr:TetR family transcriptional regulator [Planctomycetia bacterium]